MFKASSVLKAGVATVAVSGLVLGAAVSANADPSTFKTYVAVGSDTTQDVWNGLAASPLTSVGSYDAFGTATIQTRTGGPVFARPAGSGNGAKALSAAWDPANHVWSGSTLSDADIAFARSSSAPAAAVAVPAASAASADLVYIPFARDAVSVAYNPYTETTKSFSQAELKAIYGGSDENATTTVTYQTTGDLLPIVGGRVLHPKLPQNGSGTRSFFLGATAANVASLASYVEPVASTLPENNGTAIDAVSGDTRDGWLIPFSAAQWIAQKNLKVTDTTGSLLIANLDQDNDPTTAIRTAVSGSGTSRVPGDLYGSATAIPTALDAFARDTYNVIPRSQYDATSGAGFVLKNTLTGSGTGQLGSAAARGVVASYGFRAFLSSYLTDTSLTGPYKYSTFVH